MLHTRIHGVQAECMIYFDAHGGHHYASVAAGWLGSCHLWGIRCMPTFTTLLCIHVSRAKTMFPIRLGPGVTQGDVVTIWTGDCGCEGFYVSVRSSIVLSLCSATAATLVLWKVVRVSQGDAQISGFAWRQSVDP